MQLSFDRRNRLILATAMLAAVSAGPAALEASADTPVAVRLVTGPIVIDRPGLYVVARGFSLGQPGTAIRIIANDVTVELGGHGLTGPGNKQGIGVSVEGVAGVRIHGGSLSGFGTGVQIMNATNVRVEDVQVRGLDLGGPPPGEVGVLVFNSRGVLVERNVVSDTFLGFFVRGGGSGANRIANNVLGGGANGQLGICYNPDGLGTIDGPSGDLVYNNLVSRFNVGIQTSAGTAGNIFRENAIAFRQTAIEEVTPGVNLFEDNQTVAVP